MLHTHQTRAHHKTRQLNKIYAATLQTAPPIPQHLTSTDTADLATLTRLYNIAIDQYFANLQLAEDAAKAGHTQQVIYHSTTAAMASYEAQRIDTLRLAILHQANYFKK